MGSEIMINQTHQLDLVLYEKSLTCAQPLKRDAFPNQPRSKSAQLPATIPNINWLLERYGILVRYNVIKKKIEILLPNHYGTIDNMANVSMTYIISLCALNGIPNGQVPAYIEAIADRNAYNPIEEWILSKTWDGIDRLSEIYGTVIECDDYPAKLKDILIYRWLLSAVAAVVKKSGFKARGVLTFQGPQGVGKTSWIKSLITDVLLKETMIKVDHHLDGANKDSIIGAVTHWLVEIGELDSSFKKDISRLKGFLTSDFDKIRRPYARTEAEYPRRTVFFASVNQPDFLVDPTGNTRWWTIPVTKLNYNHSVDMQQLYAQLAVDYHKGEQWWLKPEEEALLNFCNKDHMNVSVIKERLMEFIDMELLNTDASIEAKTSTEVLTILGYQNTTNPQTRECGSILRDLFGKPKKINGIYKWRVPFKKIQLG
jgi:predicted P-loop ATPase